MTPADDSPRRVLVFAYYFPPLGLSGVQRVAGFVKYLPGCGWHPTVVTAKPAGYFAYDEELLEAVDAAGAAVYATRSIDPTRLYRGNRTVALPAEPARRRLAAVSQLFFVPDNKVGWIPFAARAGDRLHRARKFDAIFASAPPYSGLLAAQRVANRHALPLVVDFRDDWVENPRHRYPTSWHRRLSTRLERRVLNAAHAVTAVNRVIADSLARRSAHADKVYILPHGHDVGDVPGARSRQDQSRMRLLFTGIFYDAQTPDSFLRALALIAQEHPGVAEGIEAHFLGLLPDCSRSLITALGLDSMVHYRGYVPHAAAVAAQQDADVLWMTIGDQPGAHGISTGKLAEYMGSRKPILALIPPGTAQENLEAYRAACIVRPADVRGIARAIVRLHAQWRHGILPVPNATFVESRSQQRMTELLARYLQQSLA